MSPRTAVAPVLLVLSSCFPESVETTVAGTRVVTLVTEFANAHAVVGGDGRVVLIDSGLERNVATLEQNLGANRLDPSKVVAVVLTHGHADHAGGARTFQQKGALIYAGAADANLIKDGVNDLLCPTDADARARVEKDQAERYTGFVADVQVSAPLSLLEKTGIEGEVVPVPGHTPGSVVVRVGPSLFVGDLLRGSVFGAAAERHFYMCDTEANARDIRELLARWPDVTTWFVGHFGPLSRAAVQQKFAGP